jgi:tyrosinase
VEGLLRDKCSYKGYLTYWDWSIGASGRRDYLEKGSRTHVLSDSHDIKHSPIFNADPAVGLGTFPDANTGFELSNGAFRDIIRAYPSPHHIQRNYTLRVRFGKLSGVDI